MKKLAGRLKTGLKPGRYKHTQGVVHTAGELARRFRVSVRRCQLAAWLHDCGKALGPAEAKRLLKRSGADRGERAAPGLWHAAVGAWMAEHEFGIKDAEVLRAIRIHSTGAPGMTRLQKIIFVADYVEPGRPPWPELKRLRPLALEDLDAAFFEVLRHKIIELLKRGRQVHPRSLAAYHEAIQ